VDYRQLGSTGLRVSAVSFGAWAIGGTWGAADDAESLAALHRALDRGVNLFDTADVYGDGRSERLLGRLRRERPEPFLVATKAGRRLSPHLAEGYTAENLARFVERSLRNLGVEALDLLQLHCPPADVYYRPEVFAALEGLVTAGKVRHCGVSVERVEEGLKALEYPVVRTVQVVFNAFRQRPAERLLPEAGRRGVGILARLPLSSGMLAGGMTRQSRFAADDHRAANRHGEWFDRGETFSGVDFEAGLEAVEALRPLLPPGATMAQLALRWILSHPEVSAAIPGARRPAQVDENAAAAGQPPLDRATLDAIGEVYRRRIAPLVHQRW